MESDIRILETGSKLANIFSYWSITSPLFKHTAWYFA